jgi:hypothetical protein
VGHFSKVDKYEFRTITAIRFKCIIKDEFGEKLYEGATLTFKLPNPLKEDDVFSSYDGNRAEFTLEYNKKNKSLISLEKARLYAEKNTIVGETTILGVAFKNGDFLKK